MILVFSYGTTFVSFKYLFRLTSATINWYKNKSIVQSVNSIKIIGSVPYLSIILVHLLSLQWSCRRQWRRSSVLRRRPGSLPACAPWPHLWAGRTGRQRHLWWYPLLLAETGSGQYCLYLSKNRHRVSHSKLKHTCARSLSRQKQFKYQWFFPYNQKYHEKSNQS